MSDKTMSITSFDLAEYQRALEERVKNTRAARAAALATMPEFGAFLDALKGAGIGIAHVKVTRDDLSLEWGTPLPDARTPSADILACSLVDEAVRTGKVIPMRQRAYAKRVP